MNKERKVTNSNSVVVFNGDVKSSELVARCKDFSGTVVINGILYIDDNFCFECDILYTDAIIINYDKINDCVTPVIIIIADLHVEKYIDTEQITVMGSIWGTSEIDCHRIVVTQDLYAKELNSNGRAIIVGGDFVCDNVDPTKSISVLGMTKVKSPILAVEIDLRGPIEAQRIKTINI